jgi:protease-4
MMGNTRGSGRLGQAMRAVHRTSRRILPAIAGIAMLLGAGGCFPGGILLTPVSTNRELEETVLFKDGWWAPDKIVLIDVSGVILNAPEPQLLGEGEHAVSLLLEQLDRARGDARVRGVILRINSPGGSVTASELMYQELRRFRTQTGKPVVAVLMDVAASGGYYIACACDEIIAQPSTVTGSIGVIMQMFDVTETLRKLGVATDAITSGTHKDAGSPLRRMTPEERALFQRMVDEMYDRFVEVVAEGRAGLDEARVRELSDGRVYTGRQALALGLVDRVAPFREALEAAKRRAGVRTARFVAYHRPLSYVPNYYAAAPGPVGGVEINLLKLDPHGLLDAGAPRFMYLWQPAAP